MSNNTTFPSINPSLKNDLSYEDSNVPHNRSLENHEFHRPSYGSFIEGKIYEDERLSHSHVFLIGVINNFLKRDGYATCSNQWLSKKMRVSDRMIRHYLEDLERYGYIYREVQNNNLRRIWKSENYAEYLLATGKEDEEFKKRLGRKWISGGAEMDFRGGGNEFPPNNKEEYIKKKNNNAAPSKPPDPDIPKEQPAALSFFQKFKKIVGSLDMATQQKIERLFRENKSAIRKPEAWLTECVKNEWWKDYNDPEELWRKHQKLAQKIAKKMGDTIVLGYNYLDFKTVNGYFEFGMKDFEEKVINYLKRIGIAVEQLT